MFCFTQLYFPSQFNRHLTINEVVTIRRKQLRKYGDIECDLSFQEKLILKILPLHVVLLPW